MENYYCDVLWFINEIWICEFIHWNVWTFTLFHKTCVIWFSLNCSVWFCDICRALRPSTVTVFVLKGWIASQTFRKTFSTHFSLHTQPLMKPESEQDVRIAGSVRMLWSSDGVLLGGHGWSDSKVSVQKHDRRDDLHSSTIAPSLQQEKQTKIKIKNAQIL